MFYDLQVEISEHSKALAEVEKIVWEQGKEAMEREREMEQRLKRPKKERDDAFKERVRDREDFERLEKQMKEESERLEQEGNRRTKVWEEKARRWEEKKAEERKSNSESRERDRESWKGQVERLKKANREEEEKLKLKIEKILKEKEQEKERWEKEKEEELIKQEKRENEREREMESLEAQRLARSDVREIMNILAQQRLEEENAELRNAGMEREKVGEERKAARAILEEERGLEKKHWEQETASDKNLLSKMEGDLLSGRKLIEDLQTDKRIDRQLLVELRVQLTEPTHHTPPRIPALSFLTELLTWCSQHQTSPSPLLQTAFHRIQRGLSFSAPQETRQQASRQLSHPGTLSALKLSLPRQLFGSHQPTRSLNPLFAPPPPPPRQESPSQLPTHNAPPANAPKGPKGWRPKTQMCQRRSGLCWSRQDNSHYSFECGAYVSRFHC